jgi:hypothetical protein
MTAYRAFGEAVGAGMKAATIQRRLGRHRPGASRSFRMSAQFAAAAGGRRCRASRARWVKQGDSCLAQKPTTPVTPFETATPEGE